MRVQASEGAGAPGRARARAHGVDGLQHVARVERLGVPAADRLPVDEGHHADAVKRVTHLVRAEQRRDKVLVGDADVPVVRAVLVARHLQARSAVTARCQTARRSHASHAARKRSARCPGAASRRLVTKQLRTADGNTQRTRYVHTGSACSQCGIDRAAHLRLAVRVELRPHVLIVRDVLRVHARQRRELAALAEVARLEVRRGHLG